MRPLPDVGPTPTRCSGIATGDKRVLVVGTTNRPDRLDEAVLRRMPRRLMLDLPDEAARGEILRVLLRDELVGDCVEIADLATLTDGFSGSDLKNLCIKAAYQPVRADAFAPGTPTNPSPTPHPTSPTPRSPPPSRLPSPTSSPIYIAPFGDCSHTHPSEASSRLLHS